MELSCSNLKFSYTNEPLIRNISLQVNPGEPIWVRGKSGAGKSTFLKLLTGLLRPSQGEVRYKDILLNGLSFEEQKKFRAEHIGYVHQENHLISHWTVKQNFDLVNSDLSQQTNVLKDVGFEPSILAQKVAELSGGERQRISVARLILQKPAYAYLDEPTSHLDDENAGHVLGLLKKNFAQKVLLIVSHDQRLSDYGFKQVDFSEINR